MSRHADALEAPATTFATTPWATVSVAIVVAAVAVFVSTDFVYFILLVMVDALAQVR